jgi:PhzF family phenazine biosynthesis protein
MHTHLLRCFGARPGAGNPALVVEGGDPDPAARGALARTRATTCVFLDPPADDTGAWSVDFYYPHTRSPLCLHATLAAAAVLFERAQDAGPRAVRTAVKGQLLALERAGDDYFVRLSAHPVDVPDVDVHAAALLGVPAQAIVSPARVASVGSPKLLVEVLDAAVLHGLAPDLARITAWGKAHAVNGIYAWCRNGDGMFEGRNFNHLDPALEDAATGVAAGALTALLGRGLALRQGRATGRDCLIRTRMDGAAILVGGAVERV